MSASIKIRRLKRPQPSAPNTCNQYWNATAYYTVKCHSCVHGIRMPCTRYEEVQTMLTSSGKSSSKTVVQTWPRGTFPAVARSLCGAEWPRLPSRKVAVGLPPAIDRAAHWRSCAGGWAARGEARCGGRSATSEGVAARTRGLGRQIAARGAEGARGSGSVKGCGGRLAGSACRRKGGLALTAPRRSPPPRHRAARRRSHHRRRARWVRPQ